MTGAQPQANHSFKLDRQCLLKDAWRATPQRSAVALSGRRAGPHSDFHPSQLTPILKFVGGARAAGWASVGGGINVGCDFARAG